MDLNRRSFLGVLFAAPFVIKDGISRGVLMPVKSILEPTGEEVLAYSTFGNRLLTPAQITKEMLRMLHARTSFVNCIDKSYSKIFYADTTIDVRRTTRVSIN